MTIKTLSILAVAAALAGIAATAAIAQNGAQNGSGDGDHQSRFDAQDTNHDGYIDRNEAASAAMSRFDAADNDHDGRLSRDEVRSGVRGFVKARWQGHHHGMRDGGMPGNGMHGGRFARLDQNGDGKLTWDEMTASARARFDALDTNHDGFIDDSEMTQARGHWRHDDGAAPAQ